jgi:hypothetical protein
MENQKSVKFEVDEIVDDDDEDPFAPSTSKQPEQSTASVDPSLLSSSPVLKDAHVPPKPSPPKTHRINDPTTNQIYELVEPEERIPGDYRPHRLADFGYAARDIWDKHTNYERADGEPHTFAKELIDRASGPAAALGGMAHEAPNGDAQTFFENNGGDWGKAAKVGLKVGDHIVNGKPAWMEDVKAHPWTRQWFDADEDTSV